MDHTHDAELTQVPQYTPNPCPASPIVDPFIRSPPHSHNPTSVSSTMIPVVTLPPVVLATTNESAPASVPLPPILTADLTPAASYQHFSTTCKRKPFSPLQGQCQYSRLGQSCPNQHPFMCFKFLRYGTRGCNKLDCTYTHPKMCKTALTTNRCDRKNCLYYHKTGTIRPIPHKPTSGQSRPTIPLMELNLHPYQNNKRPLHPSLNHKASPPHTITPNPTCKIELLSRPKLPDGIFRLPHRAFCPRPTHPLITTSSLPSIPQLKQSPPNPLQTHSLSQTLF